MQWRHCPAAVFAQREREGLLQHGVVKAFERIGAKCVDNSLGVALRSSDEAVGMVVIKRESTLLAVTERGLGKCSEVNEHRVQKRGGKGILTLNRTARTGDVVAFMEVAPEDELMPRPGRTSPSRCRICGIRVTGPAAEGVKLVALDDRGWSQRLRG